MIFSKHKQINGIGYTAMLKKDFRKYKSLYLLAVPIVLYFIVFKYVPMYGVLMGFQDYSPKLGIGGSDWVGFQHFKDFFNSPSCFSVIRNTLKISFTSLLVTFPCPIVLALLLNEVRSKVFSRVVQNMSYIPHFISAVVVCGLVRVFTANTGLIGGFFAEHFGITGSMLLYPKYFLPIYVLSGLWQELGWSSIIYLSALSSIDESLYEAAKIDGANRWKQTIHVTIPGLLPTMTVLLILRMGNVLNVGYEKILLLYNDSTMEVADVISTYVYRRGLLNLDWSYSTAVDLFSSVVNFGFVAFAQHISKKVNGSGLW